MVSLKEVLECNPEDYLKDYEISDSYLSNYEVLIRKYYHYNNFSIEDLNIINNVNFKHLLKFALEFKKELRYDYILKSVKNETNDFYRTKHIKLFNDYKNNPNNKLYTDIVNDYRSNDFNNDIHINKKTKL